MRIIAPLFTACVGTTQAFFSVGKNNKFEQDRDSLLKNMPTQFTQPLQGDSFSMDQYLGPATGRSTSGVLANEEQEQDEEERAKQEEEAAKLDTNGNYPKAVGQGMGAVHWKANGSKKSNILRSGRPSGNSEEVTINTPQIAISEAHNNDVMILSSDYMYVSNCLLRRRHANDPVRQKAFDLFKQTAAGDWFIVFGYVCESDWSCWKKNVQNLLTKKGEEYGGGVIGRCVSRLVREKAEGSRARRRRRKRRDTRSVFDNSNDRL